MQVAIDTKRFLEAGEGKELSVLGHTIMIKLAGDETGGMFSMWEDVTPPHGGPPPHVHHREDETFFVLEGEFEFNVGGQTMRAGPRGQLYFVHEAFPTVSGIPAQLPAARSGLPLPGALRSSLRRWIGWRRQDRRRWRNWCK